ncbi:Alkaline phosphatase synthesis sensor protein PhoR [compost metagenome]
MIAELELAKELNTTLEDYKHSIDTALLDAKEATVLSNSLLDFARANYDSSQVSFSSLRLDEILVESKFMVQDKDKDYRVSISFDYELLHAGEDQEEILVMGNAYLLKVAFANLIENACKYSADKHCLVEIMYNKGIATIHISDKGRGISSEDLPHIFELFYRSASSPDQNGHGIGLSIVQRIIDMHDGQLFVQSAIGEGSTFTVQFNRIV